MKKLIAGVVAGLFLVGGAVMAGGNGSAVGSWNGNQAQGYSSYNFQGTYQDVQTKGSLQQQGLSMGQTADQTSSATPAWYFNGPVGGSSQAGASGQQGQVIGAGNAQMNGNFNLTAVKNTSEDFYLNKDWGATNIGTINKSGIDLSIFNAESSVRNDRGYNPSPLPIDDFSLKSLDVSKDAASWNIANAGSANVLGGKADHADLTVNGHIDYQNQTGAGASFQDSTTCAGISCEN